MIAKKTKDIGVPERIVDKNDNCWIFASDISNSCLVYSLDKNKSNCLVLSPERVETQWTRKGRPEPESKIITQGKWECAPAAFAMLFGLSLWESKRIFSSLGWNNDDTGASDEIIFGAAKEIGFELIESDSAPIDTPCILSLPSLNVKGFEHVIYWNGKEMLDPNWGFKGRKWWGTEWTPDTINHQRVLYCEIK